MKKLLSVFAAAAVLFGFASCSGDLLDGMDALPEAMYIIGNATAGGWAGAENQKMEKKGTTFSIDIDLVAGEYKFVSNNPLKMDDWSNVKTQWGTDGAGPNQTPWKHTAPGRFRISYDLSTETMTATSLSTVLDTPYQASVKTYLYGGIGTVELTKNEKIYTALWQAKAGGWGEPEGFIRCSLISCPEDKIDDPNGPWNFATARYGSGKDDPQKEKDYSSGGYEGLKSEYCVPVDGTPYTGLVEGGNFVIKGVVVGTWYKITVDMTSGSPVLSIAETEERPVVVLKKAAELQGSIGTFDLTWQDGVAVVETTLAADYKDGWNEKNPNTISFALLTVKGDWKSPCYKNVSFNFNEDAELKGEGGTKNNIVTSESSLAGKTVKLTFTGTETTIKCKAEIVE